MGRDLAPLPYGNLCLSAGLARAAGITSEESADLSTKRKGFGQDVSKHVEKLALEGANT